MEKLKLIFIAGIMGRSGTNYLARLLLNHPDVVRPRGHWELPLFDVSEYFVSFHTAFLQRRKAGRIDHSFKEFARSFGEGLMSELQERVLHPADHAKFLLHKNPATLGIEYFEHFFPKGKLIFLIRDGRDNLNSLLGVAGFADKGWHPKRYAHIALFSRKWAHSAQRMLNYATTPEKHCIVVKFEDIYREPNVILSQLSKYIGLHKDPQWLEKATNMTVKGSSFYTKVDSSFAEIATGGTEWEEIPKTEQFQPVGRWKNSWSALEKRLFFRIAGRELKALGYG